jgi:uncharacterized protein
MHWPDSMPGDSVETILIPTPIGDARAHVMLPAGSEAARAALVLGHGAGGGVGAPDLLVAQRAALGEGLAAVLVEQPYRVAGRRSPPAAARLDLAWTTVLGWLGAHRLGRCARVACRTAQATGAVGVLCLAFPLQPPARAAATRIAPSRQPELDGVSVPMFVVQGRNDRFGIPAPASGREVLVVEGDHGLKRESSRIREAVARWLRELPLRWTP